MNTIQITQTISADLLIVGSGIAGLSACVEAYSKGLNPTLITKTVIGSGASYFPLKATLGIQITGEQDESKFRQDIERVAQGQNNPKIVQAYIEDSPQAINLLSRIGFQAWRRDDNRPACFAQHSRPIYLINNWQRAAQKAREIIAAQQTPVYENATLLYIATVNQQVQGAVFSFRASGKICYIFCKTSQIILATGGIAGLYKDNLYPADVIASSHYLAQLAGAELINLEFIQFIPAFVEPKYKVLFGEHTLKYVEKITDSQGKNLFAHLNQTEFKQMMTERSRYAPFSIDFNCVEFDLVMMQHLLENPRAKGIYLHYSPKLYQDKEAFYTVYLHWLKQEVGIDLLKQPIAIAPFAHSCNGGVVIDEFAQTRVKGLFAVGEVASCIEGANRLGGNSVGGSLVFAQRAIQQILQNLAEKPPLVMSEQSIKQAEDYFRSLQNQNSDRMLRPSDVLTLIRSQMANYANVYRTRANLQALAKMLVQIEQDFCPIKQAEFHGIEIYHALKSAQLIVQAMLQRQQSLGAHYRAN
ncbi:FAD-binding protein [Bibersteinia trehalosi]|uniref:FAD-binding protein n=1 Tax=Bibersteinia trehalosi TaxID=47735 RepID=A0A3R8MDQ5_BIBTR|nr:FAD-binding protein [Bibersteinia trehalosi]RRN01076.1 FAD-binding protein [Bibersteinia trehalosi]